MMVAREREQRGGYQIQQGMPYALNSHRQPEDQSTRGGSWVQYFRSTPTFLIRNMLTRLQHLPFIEHSITSQPFQDSQFFTQVKFTPVVLTRKHLFFADDFQLRSGFCFALSLFFFFQYYVKRVEAILYLALVILIPWL